MKRLVTLFFVLAVCGTGAVAQEGAYKTVKDIAYRDAAGDGNIDTMCRLDIYYPVGKTGFSTVVWYHGGGLTGGRREIPEALKDKGLAVVGVEYRLSPTVKVADCVADAAAAAASSTQSATFSSTAPASADFSAPSARLVGFLASNSAIRSTR